MSTQYTLQSKDAYNLAIQILNHLPLITEGEQVQVTVLLILILSRLGQKAQFFVPLYIP